ncbi:MAG: hypothetical protein Q9223_007935, partial [Gallowayella weberi]
AAEAEAQVIIDTNRHSTPRSETSTANGGRHHHIKWPDAPILTNGIDPTFEEWAQAVKVKCDHDYPGHIVFQVNYAKNRTGGVAADFLRPRTRADTTQPFDDLDDLLEYLEGFMVDPDRRATASAQLA